MKTPNKHHNIIILNFKTFMLHLFMCDHWHQIQTWKIPRKMLQLLVELLATFNKTSFNKNGIELLG
jgi:hypothetical protein